MTIGNFASKGELDGKVSMLRFVLVGYNYMEGPGSSTNKMQPVPSTQIKGNSFEKKQQKYKALRERLRTHKVFTKD